MIQRACSWTDRAVIEAVDGEAYSSTGFSVSHVSTDTRDALQGALFVALEGERFNAHDFLADAIRGGAAALLVSREGWKRVAPSLNTSGVGVVVVEDTLVGLGALAKAHRQRWGRPVLAITGSNGKTTTKEMAASIGAQSQIILKTSGNLNNLIGLPMTLLGLSDAHRLAVVEMGMNQSGEIARMTEIARPDAGIVVNVGPAHIGRLGSLEAIAAAKGELYGGMPSDSVAVVNLDDERVVEKARGRKLIRTFGWHQQANVRILSRDVVEGGQRLELSIDGECLSCKIPLEGNHHASNAAAAVALMTSLPESLGPSSDDIIRGLEAMEIVSGRQKILAMGPWMIVDDTYNANRGSMLAALQMVADWAARNQQRFVALLGEMRELGEFAEVEHAMVGRRAAELGAKAVGAFGPDAEPMAVAAAQAGAASQHEAEDDGSLFDWVVEQLAPGDAVLIKGSRGIRMERFVRRFEDGI